MLKKDIDKLASFVASKYDLHGPIKDGNETTIKPIQDVTKLDYSGIIATNSFKSFFLPIREELFSFSAQGGTNNKVLPKSVNSKAIAAWGMTVMDLKALGLYDLVFAKDPYYQERRENNIVIGISAGAPAKFDEYQVFSMNLEENILEHIPFDIFLEQNKEGEFHIYSGSSKGRQVLKAVGIEIYENIQFVGLIPEEGLDPRMVKMNQKVADSIDQKVWQEIASICLACGKCSQVCPTCFCFDLSEVSEKDGQVTKQREWGNCFFSGFSEIAGKKTFLKTVKQRLFFWYEHKFVRIPNEYKAPGCVSCLRCYKVCPVGINIIEVLNKLKQDE
ncbi:MAG: hypothetical protein AUJ28_01795 [Parcubacteria group bacterium CG1_02_37_51]|uniref:4Fe-4S ferredoxin-type domain-containing protein n=2 Tax=Candidatus Komeiliibacteriota TaxID=1817908 RepID=A0A2M7RAY4_9BACT|nr:MAG: hypothetical protein AUJ28_01795 [Parcubacteria group bacterium CG1_02_37_51]PIY93938.1 MAG: hypothetical protein COY67_03375 [Candidatus Komeilibacteria bacterium CG_4_10_14_0_8_um_filter_37_78]